MKGKEQVLAQTNKKIEQLEDENEEMKEKTAQLARNSEKAKAEYEDLYSALEGTISNNKELALKLKSLENTLRSSEADLDQSVLKRESLRKEHLELAGENKALNEEIDKCLLTILEYERVNKDLQKEVENYIEYDEEARTMLNRKDAMRSLLDQVSTKLKKTEDQIAHLR